MHTLQKSTLSGFVAIALMISFLMDEANCIINGYDGCDDLAEQFPYIAYFELTYIPPGETAPITYIATSFLIAPQYIVAFPSRLFGAINGKLISLIVKIGICDPTQVNDNTFTEFTRDDIIIHPDFDLANYENNIALIRLPRPVLNVKLPTFVKSGDEMARNDCYVAGYGPLTPNGTFPNRLHIVPQPLLCKAGERTKCETRGAAAVPITQTDPPLPFPIPATCKFRKQRIFGGYLQSTEYIGPCSTATGEGDQGAPFQCSLAANVGQKANQVLIGLFGLDSCLINEINNISPSNRLCNHYVNLQEPEISNFVTENTLSECDLFA